MTVKSAKHGLLTLGASDIAEVRNIRWTLNANVKSYASSTTGGHTKTVKGQFSGTISFDVVYDPDDPIEERLKPGDQVTLVAKFDANRNYSLPCRIESLENELNIEEGEPPTVSCEALTHGAWTYPDGTVSAG